MLERLAISNFFLCQYMLESRDYRPKITPRSINFNYYKSDEIIVYYISIGKHFENDESLNGS